jgi:hypothetical protein
MSKKLPYDLTEEEIKDLRLQKQKIADYVMKQFEREKHLKSGEPHKFVMTLDDGWAKYQYDLNLTENWCMHDLAKEIEAVVKRYNGTISSGELCGAGYKENEKEKD